MHQHHLVLVLVHQGLVVVIDFSQVYYCIQKDCFLNSNGKAQITPVTQFMASAITKPVTQSRFFVSIISFFNMNTRK